MNLVIYLPSSPVRWPVNAGGVVCSHCGNLVALPIRPFKIAPITRTDRILALLQEVPERPIAELAQLVYGNTSEEGRNSVRALLSQLKRLGRAERTGPGRWRVK